MQKEHIHSAVIADQYFHRCIRGFLRQKVVLLATHQLHFLKKVDKVIVLNQGEIAECGTFDELMSNPRGRLCMLLEEKKSNNAHQEGLAEEEGSSENQSKLSMKLPDDHQAHMTITTTIDMTEGKGTQKQVDNQTAQYHDDEMQLLCDSNR